MFFSLDLFVSKPPDCAALVRNSHPIDINSFFDSRTFALFARLLGTPGANETGVDRLAVFESLGIEPVVISPARLAADGQHRRP
jgi:hypothetical protein